MHLTLSPVRLDTRPHVSVDQDVIQIGGETFDFSALGDGDVLPGAALACDWIAGPVTREGGVVRLTLRLSHGRDAPPETLFPAPVTASDGVVALPPHGDATTEAPEQTAPGVIDWSLLSTAADRAAEALAAARASASLTRVDFALAVTDAQLITEAEMDAWLAGGTLPALALDALAGIADTAQRAVARARFIGAQEIERSNPFLSLLQAQAGLTDAQVDALFGIEP